jgi:hypothetical protein
VVSETADCSSTLKRLHGGRGALIKKLLTTIHSVGHIHLSPKQHDNIVNLQYSIWPLFVFRGDINLHTNEDGRNASASNIAV